MYLENDITGQVSVFANYQVGWSPADAEGTPVSQAKIDAYLLAQAKLDKINDMKDAYQAFIAGGFVYDTNTFDLSDAGLYNLNFKKDCALDAPNRFKFCDTSNAPVDFTDEAGIDALIQSIMAEKDRIMFSKYNPYKVSINACSTVAEVEAITIDFSE